MRKVFTLFFLFSFSMVAYPQLYHIGDILTDIDGVYYRLDPLTQTAVVLDNHSSYVQPYSGEVIIPSSVSFLDVTYNVTTIGDSAFEDCNVTSVVLSEGITTIEKDAFKNCGVLTNLTIPESLSIIGGDAFEGTPFLRKMSDGVIYIGHVLYSYKGNMPKDTEITVKDGIVSISDHAFYSYSNLVSVTIPGSVTHIGSSAFWNCGLTSVNLSEGLEFIGDEAFRQCSDLSDVSIPESVEFIGGYAFQDTQYLIKDIYYDGPIYLGRVLYAYQDWFATESMPESFTIKEGTVSISPFAFGGHSVQHCPGLKSVIIPSSVKSIGAAAFIYCGDLETVSVKEGLESIGMSAFKECSNLKSFNIPSSVKTIGMAAFENCINLETVSIKEGLESIDHDAFENCYSLTSINIPSSVRIISSGAFKNCLGLETVAMEEGLFGIEDSAFENCKALTSLNIPSSVKYIGNHAFYGCNNLASITCYAMSPPIDLYYSYVSHPIFSDDIENSVPLYVPASAVDAYKEKWHFTNVLPITNYSLVYIVDGIVYKTITVKEGESITMETMPTKEGYTFSGWSEIPETMPAHDVTIAGSFSINSYKLTYMIDDKVYKEIMYEYGATITPEPQPEGNYEAFEWIDLPTTMPAYDVVIYASYTSGIVEVNKGTQHNLRIYSLDGKKQNKLQKGLNIVVLDNGTVKRVTNK